MSNNVHSINGNYNGDESLSVWDAFAQLDDEHCYVLFAQWGIGRIADSDEEVAIEIGVAVEEVWEMQERALRDIGFAWLMSQSFGTAYREFTATSDSDTVPATLPKAA